MFGEEKSDKGDMFGTQGNDRVEEFVAAEPEYGPEVGAHGGSSEELQRLKGNSGKSGSESGSDSQKGKSSGQENTDDHAKGGGGGSGSGSQQEIPVAVADEDYQSYKSVPKKKKKKKVVQQEEFF
jgi:hypothetical protein